MNHTISDEQIERLQQLLDRNGDDEDRINDVEMLDGFLSALVVGPSLVLPSEYLPQVWGEDPQWPTVAEAEEAQSLVQALWNDIAGRASWRGDEASDELMPLVALPADETLDDDSKDDPIGALWALGFLRGRELRMDAWDRLGEQVDGLNDELDAIDTLLDLPEDGEDAPNTGRRLEILGQVPFLLSDLDAMRKEKPGAH